MTARAVLVSALCVAGAVASLDADRIKLRSGTVIEGMFIGADSDSLRLLLDNGKVSEVPLSEAVSVEFSPRKPPAPAPRPAAAASPAPVTAPKPASRPAVTIAAGTPLNVRLAQTIDVDVSQAGQRFKAALVCGTVRKQCRRLSPAGKR